MNRTLAARKAAKTRMSRAKTYRLMVTRRAKKAAATRKANQAVVSLKPLTAQQFEALPAYKQRILLALDVLDLIRTKKVTVEQGVYVEHYAAPGRHEWEDCLSPAQNHKLEGEKRKKAENLLGAQANSPEGQQCLLTQDCHVCAKGALLLGDIMRTNHATVADTLGMGDDGVGVNSDSIQERLVGDREVFTARQLDTIEAAFEKESYMASDNDHGASLYKAPHEDAYGDPMDESDMELTAYGKQIMAAIEFGERYVDDDVRLYAIMMNVVMNKGDFKPSCKINESVVRQAKADPAWGRQYAK